MRRARRVLGIAALTALTAVTALAPSARAAVDPPIAIVTLGAAFSPAAVTVTVGEPVLVAVSSGVTADVSAPTDGVLTGGALGPHAYLYFGTKPGTSVISAFVGPYCAPGTLCPQWRTASTLVVTVEP